MNFKYCPNCGQQTVQKQNDTRYTCSNCDWVYWNNPRATVAVVFLKGDQALFAQRAIEPNKGKYDFPGGFTEFNEDIYQACVREVQEETGVLISAGKLRLLSGYTQEYLPGVSVVDLVFVITEWQGEFRATDDVASLEWKPLSFINDADFVPSYKDLEDKLTAFVK